MNWQVLKMQELKSKFREILEGVYLNTEYSDEKIMKYYFEKLTTKVLDYCRREELNVPLFDLIEKKLIEIAIFKKAEEDTKKNDSGPTAAINGIGIENIKSISRGDTSITLKDGEKKTEIKGVVDVNSLLEFNKEDYIILNRHRKVFR